MKVKKIKVLQVFSAMNMGGAESRMMDVFRRIDREKYHFDFLSMSYENQYFEEEIEQLGGRFIKIQPPRKSGVWGNVKEMSEVMKRGKYDAVHAHTSFHCALVGIAARLAHVPIRIAHGRTTGTMNRSLGNRIYLAVGRALMPLGINMRLAISKEAGKYLFGSDKFSVLPNAIDCEKYQRLSQSQCCKLKDEFQLNGFHPIIGMVGRFNRMKNHEFAVKWFADFLHSQPDAILVFVGESCYERQDIPKMCEELGISASVRFTGVRSDVNVWMNVFDALIVPSTFEGLGGVILEAQAAGLSVVKSDSFTNEADMELGLVQEVSLDASLDRWHEAVLKACKRKRLDAATVNQGFAARHYSLDWEIQKLCKIYSGKDEEQKCVR